MAISNFKSYGSGRAAVRPEDTTGAYFPGLQASGHAMLKAMLLVK